MPRTSQKKSSLFAVVTDRSGHLLRRPSTSRDLELKPESSWAPSGSSLRLLHAGPSCSVGPGPSLGPRPSCKGENALKMRVSSLSAGMYLGFCSLRVPVLRVSVLPECLYLWRQQTNNVAVCVRRKYLSLMTE